MKIIVKDGDQDDVLRRHGIDPRLVTMPVSPFHELVKSLPYRFCKSCERYLEDQPTSGDGAVNTDEHFGMFDVENGQVPNVDRLLRMIEVPPGSGLWIHQYLPGQLIHEQAVKGGY